MSIIDRSLTDEAINLVTGDRNIDYGDPSEDFARIATGWSEIFGTAVTSTEVALAMVWLKVCREINKPKRDNIVDAIGYLLTYDAVRAEQELQLSRLGKYAATMRTAAPWTDKDEQL